MNKKQSLLEIISELEDAKERGLIHDYKANKNKSGKYNIQYNSKTKIKSIKTSVILD